MSLAYLLVILFPCQIDRIFINCLLRQSEIKESVLFQQINHHVIYTEVYQVLVFFFFQLLEKGRDGYNLKFGP